MRSKLFFILTLLLFVFLSLENFSAQAAPTSDKEAQSSRLNLSEAEKTWLKEHRVITLGAGIFPPLDFVNEDGQSVGVGPDYMQHLEDMLGIRFKHISGDWGEIQQMQKDKKIDVLRFLTKKPEREEWLNFTKNYTSFPYVLITRQQTENIASLKDLTKKRVGTMGKVPPQFYVENNYPDIELVVYPESVDALLALVSGEVEAIVSALPTQSYLIDKHFITGLKIVSIIPGFESHIHIGVRKEWPELVGILNKGIDAITPEQHTEIKNKWSLVPPQDVKSSHKVILTPEEKAWLAAHPVIRLASDPNWAPMEFADKDGSYKGIAIDYLRIIEKRLGVRFEKAQKQPWHQLIDKARERAIDMFTSVAQTPERSEYLSFTSPYITSPVVIFSQVEVPYVGNLAGLEGKKVAVVKGYAIHEIMARDHPEIILVEVPDIEEAFEMLDSGVVSAYVGSLIVTSHHISKYGNSMVKVAGETPYQLALGMASRNDWPMFSNILQKALDSISEEERNSIYRKWISITYEHGFDYSVVWKIAGGGFFFIALFIFWNRRLKVEVERQTATIKLKEEQYRLLADNAADVIWTMDTHQNVTFISPSIKQLRGYTPEEAMAQPLEERFTPPSLEKAHEILARTIQSDIPVIFEGEQPCKDGSTVRVEMSIRNLIDDSGNRIGLIGSSRNITERKQAQDDLEKAQQLLSEAQHIAHLGSWSLDLKENKLTWSEELYTLFGMDKEMFGATFEAFLEAVHPEDRENVVKNYSDSVEKGTPYDGFHRIIRKSDHEERWVHEKGEHIKDKSGKVILTIGMVQDVTERKRAEEEKQELEKQLQQTQKMESIGTLAGGIAHDFNNILSSIFGYAEMVQDDLEPGGDAYDMQEQVLKAAGRAKDLVQQILLFSRQTDQERMPLRPDLIIKEALKLLRSSIPTTIEIKQYIPADCGCILADSTQIHQVIMNLCTNAYHAMREKGGVLSVSLSKTEIHEADISFNTLEVDPGNYIKLEVADTGHGIDQLTLEKIFNPYFTTKPKGEGTGLGLAVVHGIVKSWGGCIKVYSEPGKGTTIHIYLPRLDSEADGLEKRKDRALPKGKERILFVDDEDAVLHMTLRVLENLGYQVTAFTDSHKALKAFQAQPNDFDLLITDMTMPHITGLELSKQVFTIRPEMPVIICTGFSELISEEQAYALGIKGYLAKPVLRADLANTIRNVLA
jgi:PAS domain S-box-containing protein